MKGSSGLRRRTRNLRLKARDRGKTRIRKYLQTFKEDDFAAVTIDPSHQGIPHPRYQGRTGKVVGRQGRAYYLQIRDGGKTKRILVAPEHLTKVEV